MNHPSARTLLLVVAILAASAASAASAELVPVTTVEGITEYRLPNGLRVLLFPDPSSSTVTINVTYRVGSRHEGRGEAGMAHLLEHMVFKGTPSYATIWGALQDHGAFFNGTTWVDRTNYFETLPASAENLDFALHMEADRMVNSLISDEELAREMTVVRNEFEMGESSPAGVLVERMLAAAYLWHNYGKAPVGNKSDIERVPGESLRRFYKRYYQPDNAMLVVAGKFDAGVALTKIEQHFGALKRPERVLEDTYTIEPVQDGPRSVVLERVGSVAAAGLVYHVPAGSHADLAPLQVLSGVLADEPGGRLYQALVAANRAVRTDAVAFSWKDPGVLLLRAEVRLDQDVAAAQRTMIEVVEGVAPSLDAGEVERARARLLKDTALQMTDSRRIGIALSEYEALGDWRLLFLARDRLEAVTLADVERVARTYLVASNRTAGLFVPTGQPVRAEIAPAPDLEPLLAGYQGRQPIEQGEAFLATVENIEARTLRIRRDDWRLALLARKTRGQVVEARLAFPYGREAEMLGHVAALELMPALLMRGTTQRDYQGVQAELDRLQTELVLTGDPGTVAVRLKTTRDRLNEALRLLAEILMQPSFPPAEVELVRQERLAELEATKTDPHGFPFRELDRALYPYPENRALYRPSIDEEMARVAAVTAEEVSGLHVRLLGAGHLRAALVGDFDPGEVDGLLTELFGDFRSERPRERIVQQYFEVAAADVVLDTPDKQSAVVVRGTTLPLRDDAPSYPALTFANYVLGESSKSRLLTALRHEGGLSYGAGTFLRVDDQDEAAALMAYAMCAPENVTATQRTLAAEMERWVKEGLSAAEIEEFRTGYLLEFDNLLGNDTFLAQQLLADLEVERLFTWHRRVVDEASALTAAEIQSALGILSGRAFVEIKAGDASRFGGD